MPKVLVMYPQPTDRAAFDRRYKGEHLPMATKALKLPKGMSILEGVQTPGADIAAYYMIAILDYVSLDDVHSDFGTEAGKQLAAHAAAISSGGPPTFVICDEVR